MTAGDRPEELQAFADQCRRQCEDDPSGFLALPPPADPESGERMVWEYCCGFAAIIVSRTEEAYPAFARALDLAQARNDRLWQGRALAGLGMTLGDIGDHAEAIERLEESRALRRAIGDLDGEASALANLGVVHMQMPGMAPRAIELSEMAHAQYLAVGNARGAAATLMNVSEGLVHLALSTAQPGTDQDDTSAIDAEAHAARALPCALRAAEEADGVGMQRVSIGARLNAAHAAAVLGRIELGDQMLTQARARLEEYPAPNLAIGVQLAAGHLRRRQGQYPDAIGELRAGLTATDTVDAPEFRSGLWRELVLALEAGGDLSGALAAFRRYHREQVEERDRAAERQAQWLKARLDLERIELAEALQRRQAELLVQQNAVLTRQAQHDSLTDLPNRRALMDRLDQALATDTPRFGFALADLDHFKQVNDTFSHLIGDQVLRTVADLARQVLREVDLPARYGGEEFALVVADADSARLRAVCNRFRRKVARQPWPEPASQLHLTISIGATLACPGDTVQSLIARADQQLYVAKRHGRDRVACDAVESDPLRSATS